VAAPRVPAFAWYWAGQLVSVIGTWSQVVAVSWLLLDLTHGPVAPGTITLVQTLPILGFALPGGVIADRFPGRWLLIATQAALTVQAIAGHDRRRKASDDDHCPGRTSRDRAGLA
jgi:MFS family permease